jgi:putative DNA primase/helicase
MCGCQAKPPGVRAEWQGKALTAVYPYHRENGEVIGYAVRYDDSDGKAVIPYFIKAGQGWKSGAHPEPRPLYGLDRLAKNSDAHVLVVEGEKSADAAQRMLGDEWAVVTWQGGTGSVLKADWTPLQGRSVVIWPDADDPGIKAAKNAKKAIFEAVGA